MKFKSCLSWLIVIPIILLMIPLLMLFALLGEFCIWSFQILLSHSISQWLNVLLQAWKLWTISDKYKTAEWFTAIGTVGAVLVVVFKDIVLQHFWRPQLEVSIKNKPPYCRNVIQVISAYKSSVGEDHINNKDKAIVANTAILITTQDIGNIFNDNIPEYSERFPSPLITPTAIYLRFKIKNIGRKLSAKHVEVFAKELRYMNNDKIFQQQELAMNLTWSNRGITFYPQIHSNTEKYCDLGFILNPIFKNQDVRYQEKSIKNGPALCLSVSHPLRNGDHILSSGAYELDIVVTADEADTITKTIIIQFDEDIDFMKKEEKDILQQITCKIKVDKHNWLTSFNCSRLERS
jgi:hypothetical protein